VRGRVNAVVAIDSLVPLATDDDGLIALIGHHTPVGVLGDGEEMRFELAFAATGVHLHVGRRVERNLRQG
jgi:hypothetical protein